MLFGLAAVVVGGIYAGLAQELEDEPVSRTEHWLAVFDTPTGPALGVREVERIDSLQLFEKEVNTRALEQLRTYTFGALGLLFVGQPGCRLVRGRGRPQTHRTDHVGGPGDPGDRPPAADRHDRPR